MTPQGNFQTELVVRPAAAGERWVLVEPLTYSGCRETFSVPAGFHTDFASTPRFLWWWLPPFGRYLQAAVLHDYLYSSKPIPRKDADRIFFRVMVEARTRVWRAGLMYLAVRWFGWKAWSK